MQCFRAVSELFQVHRRLLYDDRRGVGEPLNETGIDGLGLRVRGKLQVFLETPANSARLHRTGAQVCQLQEWNFPKWKDTLNLFFLVPFLY